MCLVTDGVFKNIIEVNEILWLDPNPTWLMSLGLWTCINVLRERPCRKIVLAYRQIKKTNLRRRWAHWLWICNFYPLGTRKIILFFKPPSLSLWQPMQRNNNPLLPTLRVHPFQDTCHIISKFYLCELLRSKLHEDQNWYVSQKYWVRRKLLCWFNNKIIWYISYYKERSK